jgi:ribosomal protein L12E/L44/L45/RPP1/RPP2
VEALEALKTFDTATATYAEIKALVKALGLEVENQKQDVLIAAIEAHKVIINTEVNE